MTEEFFKRDYIISGTHAQQLIDLKNDKEEGVEEENKKLFNRNIDIFLLAPMVGFIYKRKVEKDKSIDEKNKKVTINSSQLINEKEKIEYNYQLIMLLDDRYEPDFNKRVDKAFRYFSDNDLELFNSYVRGGIEILYEKIIQISPTSEYYITNFYKFIDEFQSVYNKDINEKDYEDIFGM